MNTLPQVDIRFSVITLSDKAAVGERTDRSGPLACKMIAESLRGKCVATCILPDERELIERELVRLADEEHCHLVVTTGGTGFSPRDVAPEATRAVIEREAPGLAEAMRIGSGAHTRSAMLSRGVCGLRGTTIILNCAGSPRAVKEQLETVLPVLPHAIEAALGLSVDCASRFSGAST